MVPLCVTIVTILGRKLSVSQMRCENSTTGFRTKTEHAAAGGQYSAPARKRGDRLRCVPLLCKNGRMGESEAQTIRQPGDRLRGQPQERQHSAAEGGTRDRLPPARGTVFASGMEAEWPQPSLRFTTARRRRRTPKPPRSFSHRAIIYDR